MEGIALISIIAIQMWTSTSAMSIRCYYESWAVYTAGEGKYAIEDIDPFICTHLIYSFVGINGNGTVKILDRELDIKNDGFRRFNALKKKNPKLVTLVSMGGWDESPARFSKVASDPNLRSELVKSVVDFLKNYGFDGFDIDWEYPTARGGAPKDKENFSSLLKELRRAFDAHGFILTAAIAAYPSQVDKSYDIRAISKSLHSIHVMTYDMHSAYDKVTGENSPLYPSPGDDDKTNNVDASIQHLLKSGAPSEKIIMGIPLYGISYTLPSPPPSVKVGAPAVGPGTRGNITKQAGMLAYYEICTNLRVGNWKRSWDDHQKVPYAHGGNQWAGYDDPDSVKFKMAYATNNNLGGVMVWAIDTDDFRGICSGKYPLLTTMNTYNKNTKSHRKKYGNIIRNKNLRNL